MNWYEQSWIWAMVQAIGVVSTLMLILWQVRTQTATHVVQTMSSINDRWNEMSMVAARLHVCSQYLDGKVDFDGISEYIAEFIEELGVYVRIGAMSADQIWTAQSWSIEHYCCMFRDGIEEMRATYNDQTLYGNAEWLFNEMTKVSKKEGAPGTNRDTVDLERFAVGEVKVAKAFLGLQQ